jgi:Putative addiction module component
MSPAAEALLRQLKELPVGEREAVINALWEESGMELSPEMEAELDRREAAVASGEMKTYSMEESLAHGRERLAALKRVSA